MSSYQQRRISEQTYKFPKCTIFSSSLSLPFLFLRYTICIYFMCTTTTTMSFNFLRDSLVVVCAVGAWKEGKHFSFFSALCAPTSWASTVLRAEGAPRLRKKSWGKINTSGEEEWVIRKHKYWMCVVWVCEEDVDTNSATAAERKFSFVFAANLEGFMEPILCIQSMDGSGWHREERKNRKMKEFPILVQLSWLLRRET